MLKKLFYILVLLPVLLQGQIVINNTMTTPNLVNNVLLGSGVTTSNITFAGDPEQIGYFDATNSNIGLTEGVIMSSGKVNEAIGPNDIGSEGFTFGTFPFNAPGDPDLDQISSSSTEDAAVLEFDFITVSNTVEFSFVFASEEYPEFVNATFNDAFGLFLSGPGINGAFSNNSVNVAKIPNTNIDITIDNVNASTNSSYYINNGDGSTGPQNTDPTVVQFDGFTTKITTSYSVQCGQTYHLKVAIADVGDGAYSSAIFLEANSFSGVNPTISSLTSAQDTINCGASTTLTASSTGGTAYYLNNGLPNALGTYTVSPATTTEYMLIVEDSACNTITRDTIYHTIYVSGSTSILTANLTLANDTINCGDSTTLNASSIGGYQFTLNNGLPNALGSYTVKPITTTTYQLIAQDTNSCGAIITDTAFVTLTVNGPGVNLNPTLTTATDTICLGDSTEIIANANQGSGFLLSPSGGTTIGSYWVKPTTQTTYQFVVYDTICGTPISDTAFLTIYIRNNTPVQAFITSEQDTVCAGDSVFLLVSSFNGGDGYSLNGNPINGQGVYYEFPQTTTTYELIVYDTNVCGVITSDTSSLIIIVNPTDTAKFEANLLTGCSPLNVQFTNLSNNAANHPWKWTLDNSTTSTNTNAANSYTTGGCYDISLENTNPKACFIKETKTQYICVTARPNADFTSSPKQITIYAPTVNLENTSTNANQYEWFIDSLSSSSATNYTHTFLPIEQNHLVCLVATNDGGCFDTICKVIPVIAEATVFIPSAFSPNKDNNNETFIPVLGGIKSFEFRIYDRWGELVFMTSNLREGWDGTFKGTESPIGVYSWQLRYKTELENKNEITFGHFLLLR